MWNASSPQTNKNKKQNNVKRMRNDACYSNEIMWVLFYSSFCRIATTIAKVAAGVAATTSSEETFSEKKNSVRQYALSINVE